MTNLEFYKDEICKGIIFCKMAHILNYGKHCGTKSCVCCEFHNIDNKGVDKCIDLLLTEHKESIKLKRWEKDLLKSFGDVASHHKFDYFPPLREMKHRGYFDGVKDTSMELGDILGNCEVVE